MEDAIFTSNNLTDEESLKLPEGVIREENLVGEQQIELEGKQRTQNRKASTGYIKQQSEEEDERWRSERENEAEQRFNEINVHVIEKEEYKYVGGFKNDFREGFGICYYKNGDVYKGHWQNDKRNGWGKLILINGEIFQGELLHDMFSGYCENIVSSLNHSIQGFYHEERFVDQVIVKNGVYRYEGDVNHDNEDKSIGKLISIKKPNKIYLGQVKNYKEENGLGIFINNSTMYLGVIKNKLFENYVEMYNLDGSAYFSFIKSSLKHGYNFSFSKDGRVTLGKYTDNLKNGPFLTFSNCQNLPKSSVRTELFHLDFKSKVVDKMEPSKKYLMLNYPELIYILNVNYTEIIAKLNEVIFEEISYLNYHINKQERTEEN